MIRIFTVCLGLTAAACIHPATSAERYQAAGAFSLAMEYQNLAYEKDGREDASELIRNIELARILFKEKLEALDQEQAFERGHALVVEWVEFERWVSRLRVPGVGQKDLSELLDAWRLKASKALVAAVDASASQGEALHERLKLLRHASSLAPSDRELSQRYERLKAALSREVRVDVSCGPGLGESCQEIRGLWLESFSRVRRELVHTVGEGNEGYDTKLVIQIDSRTEEEPWYVVRREEHETNVQLFNQFREPVVDGKGQAKTKTVRALSQIEESWRRVTVRAELVWLDLRAQDGKPRTFRSQRKKESRVQYLKWTGDPRALKSNGIMDRFETSRRNPVAAKLLERQGVTEIVAELFNAWVKEVDK